MQSSWRRLIFFLIIILLLGGAFGLGVEFGFNNRPAVSRLTELINKEEQKPAALDFAPFWDTWEVIDSKFVDTTASSSTSTVAATDDEDKVWGAISGLVSSLGDPYSVFLPPLESENFGEEINGNFGGVGIEIGVRDNILTVVAPLAGTPAQRAGIQPADKIIAVDGTYTGDLTINEAINLIRGEVGTAVVLTISRAGEDGSLNFELIRATIDIPTIESEMLPQGIFVIRLFNFGSNSPELFRDALRQFTEADTDKLILDLRGNPGGLLDASVDMASWFLPAGKEVVTEARGRDEEPRVYRSRGYDVFTDKLKMVILVDGGSASASEILAGALADHGIATLVGEETFGKGSVQELVSITDETSLKITVGRWLTPRGVSLSHQGLVPEAIIEIEEEGEGDQEELGDPFVEKAVEILLEQD